MGEGKKGREEGGKNCDRGKVSRRKITRMQQEGSNFIACAKKESVSVPLHG